MDGSLNQKKQCRQDDERRRPISTTLVQRIRDSLCQQDQLSLAFGNPGDATGRKSNIPLNRKTACGSRKGRWCTPASTHRPAAKLHFSDAISGPPAL
jgi:hypothetical protein